jgi:O-antigen/teichoic acid export membrane protein
MFKKLQNKLYILSKKYSKKFGFDFTYFLKNGFWMTFRQIIGMMTGLLLSVAFARLLSKDTFGQYQFVISIMSMISIISITGLNTSIIQSVARGYDGSYIKAVKIRFLWSLVGIPALLIVGGYYYVYESQTLGLALLVSGIFFPFFYALNSWDSFLQGKERFDLSAKYGSIQSIINTLFTIGIVFFFGDNLVAITIAYFISYSIFNMLWFKKSLKYIENYEEDEKSIDFGYKITRIGILFTIYTHFDKIIVGILDMQYLAVYSIALKLLDIIKGFVKIVMNLLIPKFSKVKHRIYFRYIILLVILGLIFTLLSFLLVNHIIIILYGTDYMASYDIFKILCFVIIFYFLNSTLNAKVVAEKKLRIIYYINFIIPIISSLVAILVYYITKDLLYFIAAKIYISQILSFLVMYIDELRNR